MLMLLLTLVLIVDVALEVDHDVDREGEVRYIIQNALDKPVTDLIIKSDDTNPMLK